MPRPKSALAELEVELLMFLFCSACCLCDTSATSFAVATALCCGGFSLPLFGSTPSLGLFSYGVVLCGECNVFFLHACWDCRFSRVPFPVVFLPWANAVA